MHRDSMSSSPDAARALRVHFVVHHERDPHAGAAGATLSLAAALEQRGCTVSYFWMNDAFPSARGPEVLRMLRFPWKVSAHLARTARHVDVIDATTGDAWLWCTRGRPEGGPSALVTRSHGLEHVAVEDLRRRAATGEIDLSRKFAVYHGGLRLWEVARSVRCADAQLFLNPLDRDFAVARLGMSPVAAAVVPNGVDSALLSLGRDVEPETPSPGEGTPIALAFIGSWIPRKGIAAIAAACAMLHRAGTRFTLRLLGTGVPDAEVLRSFERDVAPFVTAHRWYERRSLPSLLEGAELLLHPSWTEGFSLGLAEGMACGLAPLATRSGGATAVVRDDETGILLEGSDSTSVAGAMATAITMLAGDPSRRHRLRRAAQREARALTWDHVAGLTLDVYAAAIARRRVSQ